MRIKALLAAVFCAACGAPLVAWGFRYDPIIWEAVVVGIVAVVVGPIMAGLVLWDLSRSRTGAASEVVETAFDVLKP